MRVLVVAEAASATAAQPVRWWRASGEGTPTSKMSFMSDPVRLAIVGCGGMGRRHLAGLAELLRTEYNNVQLVAVCDPNQTNAEDLAVEAAELLGERPTVFATTERMVAETDGLEAA